MTDPISQLGDQADQGQPISPAMTGGSHTIKVWLMTAIFAVLPPIGLVNGPIYAGLIFGLAGVCLLLGFVMDHRAPTIERRPLILAGLFCAFCWASSLWSIDPHHSRAGALQLTAILAAVFALWGSAPVLTKDESVRLGWIMAAMIVVAAAYLAFDLSLGYKISVSLGLPSNGTKYNRGIIHGLLLAWPLLAWYRPQRRQMLMLGGVVTIMVMIGPSATAKAAFLGALVVLLTALVLPRLCETALAVGTLLIAAPLPFVLRLIEVHRAELGEFIKFSALHRLELWDYMSSRVLEHPWLGWGLSSASRLTINPDELQSYLWAKVSNYPHNQFLQLWVETGAVGVALALTGLMVGLFAIRRLSTPVRPFAYAGYAMALIVALADFEFTTDSWMAALAAMVLLFKTFDRVRQER